ncbi:hypothetical protein MSBR3_0034 [Methanosarcina barkeri 3]|uniref:Uncharacterized protein n=1 Tax=Methanosarcina barkeri 3 TaxID=1434107 RepID=A0A0E3SJ52_METBA|nr:hypothetical protein MSBR3_0034 [Methanosarcina barkeri 3]
MLLISLLDCFKELWRLWIFICFALAAATVTDTKKKATINRTSAFFTFPSVIPILPLQTNFIQTNFIRHIRPLYFIIDKYVF